MGCVAKLAGGALLAVLVLIGINDKVVDIDPRPSPTPDRLELERRLAERYLPILMLTEGDYRPMRVEDYLPGGSSSNDCVTDLRWKKTAEALRACALPDDLLAASREQQDPQSVSIDIRDITPSKRAHRILYRAVYRARVEKVEATTYFAVREAGPEVWIDFWLFYFYNDTAPLPAGDHEGDWERIQVRVEGATLEEALKQDEASSFAFSRHSCDSDAQMPMLGVGDDSLHLEGRQPVAYVARGSHANYFDPGGGYHSPLDRTGADGRCPFYKAGVFDYTPAMESTDDHPGAVQLELTPVALLCSTTSPYWADYPGHWGEYSSGPKGPCSH